MSVIDKFINFMKSRDDIYLDEDENAESEPEKTAEPDDEAFVSQSPCKTTERIVRYEYY